MFKTIVTWATLEDMINVEEFVAERREKLAELKSQGLTDAIVTTDRGMVTGSINFISRTAADDWITYIQMLANKYNKQITNTSIVEV